MHKNAENDLPDFHFQNGVDRDLLYQYHPLSCKIPPFLSGTPIDTRDSSLIGYDESNLESCIQQRWAFLTRNATETDKADLFSGTTTPLPSYE